MKGIDFLLLALGMFGTAFCLYVSFANPNAPAVTAQALTTFSVGLLVAGYLGWRLGRKE